jgi:hypothetical protein
MSTVRAGRHVVVSFEPFKGLTIREKSVTGLPLLRSETEGQSIILTIAFLPAVSWLLPKTHLPKCVIVDLMLFCLHVYYP